MNYEETLHYLFNRYPVFERSGALAYKPGLHNIEDLLDRFGNPHRKIKSIHIAGTNGKGSCSHLLASILMESGYKTGLYTSPHLKDFNERIRIAGLPIEHERIVNFVQRYRSELEKVEASFFEISTVMAFCFFAEDKIDIAVIETGMGGRLDATNVVSPELCIITNVGLDHQQFLGNTLEEIAAEKAGIIKYNTPVIVGHSTDETRRVFERIAEGNKADIYFNKDYLSAEAYRENDTLIVSVSGHHGAARYECGLHGEYQRFNVPTVLMACSKLMQRGWKLTEESVRAGIANVQQHVPLLGRWQTLHERPLIVCDIAHNEPGWRELLPQFTALNAAQGYIILGFAADKSVQKILSMIPDHYKLVFSQADSPRAISAEDLKKLAEEESLSGNVIPNVNEALAHCLSVAGPDDAILIAGSNYLIAELNYPVQRNP